MIFTYYANKESYTPTYFLMWDIPKLLISGTTRESFKNFKEGKITKEQLPIIVASGIVEPGKKTNANVTQHSGIILLDLDRKDNSDIEKKINDINNERFTYFSFRSPHGGYKIGIYTSIQDVKEHAAYYDAISEYYCKEYKVVCDNRCRNIARFCFLPYDEDNYINPCSEKFTIRKECTDQSISENNLKKGDNDKYSDVGPKSSINLSLQKGDNNINNSNSSDSIADSISEKKDNNGYRIKDPISSTDINLVKRDNIEFNERDSILNSLIRKGTYAGIIFSNTRYKNIMCILDPFYQKSLNLDNLDYTTRIDESYFSGDCQTYYVEGGIRVCQIRFNNDYKIKQGKRNKTLGSFCLKLIFNNPFASCERIQKEILTINEKYCEEPLTSKECIDIVRYNHDKFLLGELDFSKVIRQNYKGICRQFVFFSRAYIKYDPKISHNLAVEAFHFGKKASKTNLISMAIENLQTGEKITINRIAEYLKVNEKMIDRNLNPNLKEKYKSYNKSLKNTNCSKGQKNNY